MNEGITPIQLAAKFGEKEGDLEKKNHFKRCFTLLQKKESKIVKERYQRNITPEKQREIINAGKNSLEFQYI